MFVIEILEGWKTDLVDYASKSLGDLYKMLKTAIKGSDEHKEISAAIKSKENQISKVDQQRAELQAVTGKLETDPEILAKRKEIQSYRGELNKRERKRLADIEKLNDMRDQFEKMDMRVLQDILKKERKGTDFHTFIQDIVDDKLAKQDLLKSVSGNIKQGTSIGAKATGPWAQLGITREKFRKILQNPQDPRHAEVKRLWNDYKTTESIDLNEVAFALPAVSTLLMVLGTAWSAYDAYELYRQYRDGEITKQELIQQVGEEVAYAIMGLGVIVTFKQFKKLWTTAKKMQQAKKV